MGHLYATRKIAPYIAEAERGGVEPLKKIRIAHKPNSWIIVVVVVVVEIMMSAQPQPAMAASQGYQPHHQPTSVEEVRTLWIGDLQYWVDENYLSSCFAHTGEVSFSPSLPPNICMIRVLVCNRNNKFR